MTPHMAGNRPRLACNQVQSQYPLKRTCRQFLMTNVLKYMGFPTVITFQHTHYYHYVSCWNATLLHSISTGHQVTFLLTTRAWCSQQLSSTSLLYKKLCNTKPLPIITLFRERLAQFWGGGWFCKTAPHSGWNFSTTKNYLRIVYLTIPIKFSDRELRKLKEHKYSSSCASLLDPTMQK